MAENTPRYERRSAHGHRDVGSSRLPRWVIPVVTVVIAITAAWIMETLQEQAIQDRTAHTVLVAIEEDAAQEHLVADEVPDEGEVSPKAKQALANERREARRGLDNLESLNLADEDVARIRKRLSSAEAAV